MSKYNGSQQRICSSGGAVRVTLDTNDGQGNGGTSLPCKGCWVQAADSNTDVVRMNIGVAATDTLGVDLARAHTNLVADSYGVSTAQPMWVPISDVAQLYFHSAGDANAIIDILYLVG